MTRTISPSRYRSLATQAAQEAGWIDSVTLRTPRREGDHRIGGGQTIITVPIMPQTPAGREAPQRKSGKPVCVGWAAHELVWLHAAASLPDAECDAALRDIAGLTGRSYSAVRFRAWTMAAAEKDRLRAQRVAAKMAPRGDGAFLSALAREARQ